MNLLEIHAPNNTFIWIDVTNPTMDDLNDINKRFNLNNHNLLDSLEPDHLPKFEENEESNFVILRKVLPEVQKAHSVQTLTTKIAVFYNDKLIVTIHRLPHPELESIADQFVKTGKIASTYFLLLKIISRVQSTYNQFSSDLNKQIDDLETRLFLKKHGMASIDTLYMLKRKTGITRKLLLLTGDVITQLHHRSKKSNEMQDIRDNHAKLVLFFDQLNEDAQTLLSTYMSHNAQKTNEVMKVLTLFSAYFLPLTFIVGVYGMNFKFMPELDWHYGYPAVIVLMVVVFIGIYAWFKRKKWL